MADNLDLTIIIVNWNAGAALHACIRSIRDSRTRLRSQVIVVDNASSDGSREQTERDFPDVQVVNTGANLGFARANNMARRFVNSQFVLFLNPDSIVQPGALDSMVSAFAGSPEIGAVGCKMRYADGRVWEQLVQRFPSPWTEFLGMIFASSAARKRLPKLFPYLDPYRSGYASKVCGGCFMARKTVLDAVGWFDERYFMYAEDADLSQSILQKGLRLFYVSDAEISHIGGESSRKTVSDFPILMHCESMAKLMQKHYGRFGRLNYRLALLAGASFRLLATALLTPALLLLSRSNPHKVINSFRKYGLILGWSLHLKKASIPAKESYFCLEPAASKQNLASVVL